MPSRAGVTTTTARRKRARVAPADGNDSRLEAARSERPQKALQRYTEARMTGLYVYGILLADHPEPDGLLGIGEAPVQVLRRDAVAAAVSAAPEPLVGRRRELLAHSAAVESLWA